MKRSRNEQITALFQSQHAHVVAAVRTRVIATDAVIEDAVAFAWATLARRDDIDVESPTIVGWLITIATHEGWRYAAEQTAGAVDESEIEHAASGATVEDTAAAREALALIEALPERERRVMRLFAAGYGYKEIAAILGVTYTNVNKHLTRARKHLREMRGEA